MGQSLFDTLATAVAACLIGQSQFLPLLQNALALVADGGENLFALEELLAELHINTGELTLSLTNYQGIESGLWFLNWQY